MTVESSIKPVEYKVIITIFIKEQLLAEKQTESLTQSTDVWLLESSVKIFNQLQFFISTNGNTMPGCTRSFLYEMLQMMPQEWTRLDFPLQKLISRH